MTPLLSNIYGSLIDIINRQSSPRFELYGMDDHWVIALEQEIHGAIDDTGFFRKIIHSWTVRAIIEKEQADADV